LNSENDMTILNIAKIALHIARESNSQR